MHDIIHNSAIIPQRSQQHSLPTPPSLPFPLLHPSIPRPLLPNPIKHLREPPQRPLLGQMRRQNPLPLHLHLSPILVRHTRFQLLDLLVRMHVDPLRGQAGYQRSGQWGVGEGGVGMDGEGGPGVLVLEVVEDLEGEGLVMRRVYWGRGSGFGG